MGDLLIRDLPTKTHAELKRRANEAGTSLQSYVTEVLTRATSRPTIADWLLELDELPRHPGLSGADAVREAHTELP